VPYLVPVLKQIDDSVLTAWSRVIPGNIIVAQVVKKSSHLM